MAREKEELEIDEATGVPVVPGEEGMSRQEDEPGGMDVPGVDVGQAGAAQPEEGPGDR